MGTKKGSLPNKSTPASPEPANEPEARITPSLVSFRLSELERFRVDGYLLKLGGLAARRGSVGYLAKTALLKLTETN